MGQRLAIRGEDWGSYKGVVNCNTCRLPGLRITKESIWGFFEGRTPEDRLGLPLERSQTVGLLEGLPSDIMQRTQNLQSCSCGMLGMYMGV